jgi:membrane-bound lytic murein transglycosylase D
MIRLFAIATLAFLASSCQTTQEQTPNVTAVPVTMVSDVQPVPLAEAPSNDVQETNSTFPPYICDDGIYTKYLEAEIAKEHHYDKNKRGYRPSARFEANKIIHGSLWSELGSIPISESPLVQTWIDYFRTRGHQDYMKWLIRSEAYRDLLIPLLVQEGIPKEIFFLAMIESGFSNSAYSRARATGTWQFMKATAKSYGLQINYWVDERRDPVKSTIAAARFLRDLYGRFGDWYLAIAAYNAGPGKIKSAIRRAKSRDYWKIAQTPYIKRETKHYVPKMLAALIIASNPQKYGFDFVGNPQERTPSEVILVSKPASLTDIANRIGISVATLKRWNPEILRGVIPPSSFKSDGGYPLRLAAAYHEKFREAEDDLPTLQIDDVQMHRIVAGDTLAAIARRYKISVGDILALNPQISPRNLRIGHMIAIPVPFAKTVLTKRET